MSETITTCLWFEGQAEQAARFYTDLLPNSAIDSMTRAPMDYPGGAAGSVLTVNFTLMGQQFMALNGGAFHKMTPAISLIIPCADQAEVDRIWAALEEGGSPMACGWITDRFGLSWQVTPIALTKMMTDPDPVKVKRVMEAFMPMIKLDIATLEKAYHG